MMPFPNVVIMMAKELKTPNILDTGVPTIEKLRAGARPVWPAK